MKMSMRRIRRLLALGAVLLSGAVPTLAEETPSSRYMLTTIRGTLIDTAAKQPMVGAKVRFASSEEGGGTFEGTTDERGAFVVEGLPFAVYDVDVVTADGEEIQGLSQVPVKGDGPARVVMKISKRLPSKTVMENQPQRFLVVVQNKNDWPRFWKEFAVFFGFAATGGAAAW